MNDQQCPHCARLRDQLDEAEERERQLREALYTRPDILARYRTAFSLSNQQAKILTLLMEMPEVSHEALLASTPAVRRFGDHRDDLNVLKTNVSRLRKALEPYGGSIETLRGWGYWMTKDSKDAVRKAMTK